MTDQAPLPGMNTTVPDPDMLPPATTTAQLGEVLQRPVILIATATINKGAIFTNGLYQNIYMIYRLCEALGYLPFFLFNTNATSPEPFLADCRILTVETLMKSPLPVKVYLEIGMSIDVPFRKFMKALGARNIKLYLGNILNIDVETIQFYTEINFSHHVVGEMDEIWVSPHYEMHREYAGVLNHVPLPAAKIAPYVWDPCFISDHGRRKLTWRMPAAGEPETYIIMEPNISFQKSALIPLLALSERARANPGWSPRVIIVNGQRLLASGHFVENILPNLAIRPYCDFRGRATMVELMEEFPHASFVCHQVNNEYKYMILELLYCGFPVIHNGERWAEFGYTYKGNSLTGLNAAIDRTRTHKIDGAIITSRAQTLFWRHSIHNPIVQDAWATMLESKGQ